MKKLLGRGQKKEEGALINKTVQVGQYHVRVETMLGQGGYADIYRVRDASSGQTFALKHLRLQGDQEHITEVQREAKTMAKLRGHPNVLRLYAVAFAGPKGGETDGFFLLDFCPGTLIAAMHTANYNMDDAAIVHAFSCVAQGVAHMHRQSPPMTHRDLKAENVLQLQDGTWVLCDFGSATTRGQVYATAEEMAVEEEVIRKHTTPAYRAPEMWDLLSRQLIDTKVDIWALGVMLFVLAFGKLPFQGDSKLQILYGKYEMPALPARAPLMRSLISSMLTVNPEERPDIDGVLAQLGKLRQAVGLPQLSQPRGQELKRPSPSGPVAAAAGAASGTRNGVQPAGTAQSQQPQQQQQAASRAAPPGGAFFAPAAAPAAAVPNASNGGLLRGTNSDGGSSSSSLASSRQPPLGASTAAGSDVPRRSSDGASAAIQHGFSGDHTWADFGEAKQAAAAPSAASSAAPAAKSAPSSAGGAGPTPQQQQQLQHIMQKAAQAKQRQPPPPPSQHTQPASTTAVLAPPPLSRQLQGSSSQQNNVRSSSAPPADATSASTAAAASASASASGTRPPLSTSISNKRGSSGLPSPTPASPTRAKEQAAAQPQHAAFHQPQKQQQRQASADTGASLRDEVLGEMDLLRVQVVSLADHNKALVFRIKQLEEEVVQQRRDMSALQASVRQLHSRSSAEAAAAYENGPAATAPYPSGPVPAAQVMPQPVLNGYYAGSSSGGAGAFDAAVGTREWSQGGAGGSHSDGGASAGGGSFWSKFGEQGGDGDAGATRQPALRSHQLASSPGRHDDLV